MERIKRILRENDLPFFTDEDIQGYLDDNKGNVEETIYELLIIKSENTSLQINGLTTTDTAQYFLRLAEKYRPSNSGII